MKKRGNFHMYSEILMLLYSQRQTGTPESLLLLVTVGLAEDAVSIVVSKLLFEHCAAIIK